MTGALACRRVVESISRTVTCTGELSTLTCYS